MAKKVMSRNELSKEGNKIAEKDRPAHRKSNRPAIQTKKEKKRLGIGRDEGRAILRYARISSSKVRIVIDLVRGKDLDEAYAIISYTPKAASEILIKVLKSAEANAVNNNGLDRDKLYVAEAYADQGPTLKELDQEHGEAPIE